jgi:acyl-CoA synthetase (AMP-forming)/AMP-acid ligase II
MRRFELEPFLQNIEKYGITDIVVVPPMAVGIVKSPLSKHPFLKKVRNGFVGAAPLDKDVQAKFYSLMSEDSTFNQVWGMTETTCVATMFYYDEHDTTGSVGRPVQNLEMK